MKKRDIQEIIMNSKSTATVEAIDVGLETVYLSVFVQIPLKYVKLDLSNPNRTEANYFGEHSNISDVD